MQGNPIAYRNLYKNLQEILNYLDISLDADFVMEELNAAQYECEVTFGKNHQFTQQLKNQLNFIYNRYIDKKALTLEKEDERKLRAKIEEWLGKYYKKIPI